MLNAVFRGKAGILVGCKVGQAVERYGYSQREVADHLGMHFTSISRIIRERNGMLTK